MNRTYKYLLLYELHRIIYDVDLHFHIRQNQNKETSQEQCPVVDNSNKKYVFIHDLNWSDIKQAWKKARYPHIDTEKIEWNNVLEQKSTCTYVNETIWRTINVPWILIIWTFTFYKKFITHSTFIVDGNYLVYYEILFIWYVCLSDFCCALVFVKIFKFAPWMIYPTCDRSDCTKKNFYSNEKILFDLMLRYPKWGFLLLRDSTFRILGEPEITLFIITFIIYKKIQR